MASELPQARDPDAAAGVADDAVDEQAARGEAPNNQAVITYYLFTPRIAK